jgi:hypothetical protein
VDYDGFVATFFLQPSAILRTFSKDAAFISKFQGRTPTSRRNLFVGVHFRSQLPQGCHSKLNAQLFEVVHDFMKGFDSFEDYSIKT